MGGVINIVTRKPAEDGTRTNLHMGYGSFNTFESELFNTTRYGKFSSAVSGSYSRSDGHRDNMNFEQYGGYAKLGYNISDNWDISANLDVTRFIASQPGPKNAPLIDADRLPAEPPPSSLRTDTPAHRVPSASSIAGATTG